jgi:hypothetical protein
VRSLKEGVPGLVNRHISGRIREERSLYRVRKDISQKVTGEIKVYPGGIVAKREGLKGAKGSKNHNRGAIKGFSSDSKRRMRGALLEIDWEVLLSSNRYQKEARCLFLSLTYPEHFSHDWHIWKGHLKAIRKRLKRAFGNDISALWKWEPQPSRSERLGVDAPHFHLVVDFTHVLSVRMVREWIAKAWYEVVGSEDPKHLHAGTGADPVYGPIVRLEKYLVKYLGKTFDTETHTGRVWGIWGEFPHAQCLTHTGVAWFQFLRRVRRWGRRSGYIRNIKHTPGLILYGKGLGQLTRNLAMRQ